MGPSTSFNFLYPLRNASTKVKAKSKKAQPASAPSIQQKGGNKRMSVNPEMSWTIEPRVGYWTARIRTPLSRGVVLGVVSLALCSVVSTSLSMPDPETTTPPPSDPSKTQDPSEPPKPQKSFLSTLFTPVTFIFRPILVSPEVRAAAETTPLFWVGTATGFAAIALFCGALFFTPRYTRSLTISPASLNINKGGVLRFTPAWGRPVTVPLKETVLVAPVLLDGVPPSKANAKAKEGAGAGASTSTSRDVLKTLTVQGHTLRGALLGWGLPMLKNGAVVNGKEVPQGEVVRLLERIWAQRGGEIAVEGSRK